MFGLGAPELIILLIIILIIFGPGKLPEIGKSIGRGIREFKSASEGRDEGSDVKEEKAKNTEKNKNGDNKN